MQIMILLIGIAAAAMTLLGGFFAMSFKDKLHLILGFSAGAVISVAFFDLLPEALELSANTYASSTITTLVAVGFIVYLMFDRFFLLHGHSDEDHECNNDRHRMTLGAGSLSIHSFLDGVAVGLAYQVSFAVGIVVTVAVLVHDFSDGVNTTSVVLSRGGTKSQAFKWLWVDAVAPLLGIISTFFFKLSENHLALLLALFCGFFLYIGASDLLPESHHRHPTHWTTIATALGMGVMFLAIRFAGV